MYNVRNEKIHELSEFLLELARELFEEYGSKRSQMKGRPSTESPLRLTARHFIAFIPEGNVEKRCFVCSHTVKRGKNEAIQGFIAQTVMYHCVIRLVSRTITLEKHSDESGKNKSFLTDEKFVIFVQNQRVLKGLTKKDGSSLQKIQNKTVRFGFVIKIVFRRTISLELIGLERRSRMRNFSVLTISVAGTVLN